MNAVAESDPRLREFESLLREHAVARGMVSYRDSPRMWDRHIADSLRCVTCLPARPVLIADLGSGAGLPGIPVAIARPDCRVTLIEARQARAAFLEFALRTLNLLNATVEPRRIQEVSTRFGVCLARGLAPLSRTIELAAPLLEPDGELVYFAGAGFSPADHAIRDPRDVRVCSAARFPWEGDVVMIPARSSAHH